MSADPYAVATFEAFWPHYVSLHTRPETHALHAVATLSCLGLLGAAAITGQPMLALAAPLVDYAIAQSSHRLFEANRTTPWKNQLWHTRAELRMLRLVLTGRMAREVERSGLIVDDRPTDQVQMAMVRTPARLPDGVRPTMRTETATPSTLPCRPARPK